MKKEFLCQATLQENSNAINTIAEMFANSGVSGEVNLINMKVNNIRTSMYYEDLNGEHYVIEILTHYVDTDNKICYTPLLQLYKFVEDRPYRPWE